MLVGIVTRARRRALFNFERDRAGMVLVNHCMYAMGTGSHKSAISVNRMDVSVERQTFSPEWTETRATKST